MSTASLLVEALRNGGLTVTTAESCTAGMISAAITDISGSSDIFEQGIVSYANEVKTKLLGVEAQLIDEHGAVSEAVAIAMAQGALKSAKADIAISATGIAGPNGGSSQKPVGLVYIGIASKNGAHAERFLFKGDRAQIRAQAVEQALLLALESSRSFSSSA